MGNLSAEFAAFIGLPEKEQAIIRKAGIIHDNGKIGIGDYILHKSGVLTKEEIRFIEQHTVIGEKICRPLHSLSVILPGYKELGFALGAVDYLVKPVDKATILSRLEQISLATKNRCYPVTVLTVTGDAGIQNYPFLKEEGQPSGRLTASAGILEFSGQSAEELLQSAEKALLLAVEKGRNRVEAVI